MSGVSLHIDWQTKTYHSNPVVQRKPSNGKDLAYLDDDVPEKEELHLSAQSTASADRSNLRATSNYLRPTAAFFLSDLHIKKSVTSIATPQRSIEPNTISLATNFVWCICPPRTQVFQIVPIAQRDSCQRATAEPITTTFRRLLEKLWVSQSVNRFSRFRRAAFKNAEYFQVTHIADW